MAVARLLFVVLSIAVSNALLHSGAARRVLTPRSQLGSYEGLWRVTSLFAKPSRRVRKKQQKENADTLPNPYEAPAIAATTALTDSPTEPVKPKLAKVEKIKQNSACAFPLYLFATS